MKCGTATCLRCGTDDMRKFPASALKKFSNEFSVFKKLDSPGKVQDFLDGLRINFETKHATLRSPLMVLRHKEAHCVEGAMLAAAAFWYHARPPLLLDLVTSPDDYGHVVALFRQGNRWGAAGKTNHAVLQYRDPVYTGAREIAMSYFNEYFLDSGIKTLRSYSAPFDMRVLADDWLTARRNLWEVNDALDAAPHTDILGKGGVRLLRPARPLEIKAGKIVQWKRK